MASLLQKEKEYHKLNEEIQNTNKKLMDEFNTVLKKQETVLKESFENIKPDYTSNRKNIFPDHVYHQTFCSLAKENCNKAEPLTQVPETVEQMGYKGATRFYKAKINAMQNEFDALNNQHKNKCDELRKLQKESARLNEEKDKWFQAHNWNKTSINKLENQITILNSKLVTKENENSALRKELDQVKKNLKDVNTNVSASEIKLNRALEENEKIKSILKITKQEEKELKEAQRKEFTEITSSVKRLEKHKTELLAAFKKQLQLIDNLKKQKVCLESIKLAEITENEFTKILDWKIV